MLCLALGGVCLQVVIGERRGSRVADPGCFVFVPWCCLWSWMVCIHVCFHLLSMLVGDVVCHHGAVLESVVSGVFPWMVSASECCVLLLEVCVCRL